MSWGPRVFQRPYATMATSVRRRTIQSAALTASPQLMEDERHDDAQRNLGGQRAEDHHVDGAPAGEGRRVVQLLARPLSVHGRPRAGSRTGGMRRERPRGAA